MSFFTKKEQIVILLIVIVIIVVVGYNLITDENITIVSKDDKGNLEIGVKRSEDNNEDLKNKDDSQKEKQNKNKANKEEIEIIMVHITGQVHKPGVAEIPDGARLTDALKKVGGLIEDKADKDRINLSKKLVDEEKIYIPAVGEDLEDREIYEVPTQGSYSDGINRNGKVDINVASKNTLTQLPGVGEVIADRIINYRNKNKFNNINELTNVSGIGVKKFESIKDLVTVD